MERGCYLHLHFKRNSDVAFFNMVSSYGVLEHINTLTVRWQANLIGVFCRNSCENGVCSCYNFFFLFFSFSSSKATHVFDNMWKWEGWYTKLATQTETLLKKERGGEGEEIVNIQPNLQPTSFYFTREIPDPLRLISGVFNHFSDAFLFVFLNIFFYFPFLRIFLPIFPVILRHFFSNMLWAVNR